MKTISNFLTDETGATAIEYGIIAALLSIGVLGGVQAYGADLARLYNDIYTAVAGTHSSA
jgi:pilus assembly protein Flp/PilA